MGLVALMEAVKDFLEDLNDGATPTPNYFFDQVWLGKPNKLPMNTKCVAFTEISDEPDFYYTTCPTYLQEDVNVMITIMSKGKVEVAHGNLYNVVDNFKNTWKFDQKFGGACIGSSIESIEYGDIAASQVDSKMIATAARITIKCRMDGLT